MELTGVLTGLKRGPVYWGQWGPENALTLAAARGDLERMMVARVLGVSWNCTLLNAAGAPRSVSTPPRIRTPADRAGARRQRTHPVPAVGSGQRMPLRRELLAGSGRQRSPGRAGLDQAARPSVSPDCVHAVHLWRPHEHAALAPRTRWRLRGRHPLLARGQLRQAPGAQVGSGPVLAGARTARGLVPRGYRVLVVPAAEHAGRRANPGAHREPPGEDGEVHAGCAVSVAPRR